MDIVIDLTTIQELSHNPPYIVAWELFKYGGWVLFLFVFLWGLREMWLNWRQGKYAQTLSNMILAIDIPKNNEQTPKAVESIFAHLAGAHMSINFYEKWWVGKFQEKFSLELISINGHVQFLIRTPTQFRDLVEAAVYSQYPDAEITEVEDYTKDIPIEYPDEVWDFWGSELILVEKDYLPIRTYISFEHPLTGDLKDPMGAVMEQFSNLKNGEQLWFQIIIEPISQDWADKGVEFMNKIMGKTSAGGGKGVMGMLKGETANFAGEMRDQITGLYGQAGDESGSFDMFKLTPREKNQLEGTEQKISKIGYKCALRMAYVARKEVMNKSKVLNGFFGTMKQFCTNNLNALKPDIKRTGTRANYLFIKRRIKNRQRKLMRNYKNRAHWEGSTPFVLNIEELATIFHFPIIDVKAPLVQKTESIRSEPPAATPYADAEPEDEGPTDKIKDEAPPEKKEQEDDREDDGAPFDLPIG